MFHIIRQRFRLRYFIIGLLILLWWLNRRQKSDQELTFEEKPQNIKLPPQPFPEKTPHDDLKTDVETLSKVPETTTIKPHSTRDLLEMDDLKRIEGIGPKISSVLAEAGINSYSKLASMSSDEIRSVLKSDGIHTANPDSWSEQAELAADGKWDRLEAFQEELKGGRRSA